MGVMRAEAFCLVCCYDASVNRRQFIGAFAAGSVAGAQPQGSAMNIALGFDSYSLRAFQWKAPRFLEYAASQKLDSIQFSSLNDFESLDPAYLANVKAQASKHGISVD